MTAPQGASEQSEPARPRRSALAISLAVGLLAALLVGVLATRDPSSVRVTRSPLLGHIAPAIAGPTLAGDTFDLADQRGRWVVANFFATWCTPCLAEHPELVAFEAAHRAAGDAGIVSILFDDQPEEARTFFAESGGTWPVLIDGEGAIGVAYGVARVPESFLIAPDGTVLERLVGGVTATGLDEIIAAYQEAAGAIP